MVATLCLFRWPRAKQSDRPNRDLRRLLRNAITRCDDLILGPNFISGSGDSIFSRKLIGARAPRNFCKHWGLFEIGVEVQMNVNGVAYYGFVFIMFGGVEKYFITFQS
jgi:hypothetical protein